MKIDQCASIIIYKTFSLSIQNLNQILVCNILLTYENETQYLFHQIHRKFNKAQIVLLVEGNKLGHSLFNKKP